MDKFSKRLDNLLGLPIIENSDNSNLISYDNNDNKEFLNQELSHILDNDLKTDYDKTRDNLSNLIEKGTEAVDDILAIARQSEKSRDFEVASNMIKNMVEATRELITLQKEMREITGKKSTTNNIKNAVFIGSTNDFLKSLNEKPVNELGEDDNGN